MINTIKNKTMTCENNENNGHKDWKQFGGCKCAGALEKPSRRLRVCGAGGAGCGAEVAGCGSGNGAYGCGNGADGDGRRRCGGT